MPPKKSSTAASTAKVNPAATKSKVTKTKAPAKETAEEPAKPAKAVRLTKAQANKAKVEAKIAESNPSPKAAAKPAPAKSNKRKADEDDVEQPVTKKTRTSAAEAKTAPKKAPITKKVAAPKKAVAAPKKPAAKPAPKTAKKAEPVEESDVDEAESGEEESPEPVKKSPPKKAAARKKVAAPKKFAAPKVLPTINEAPTQILDVFVFGEGSAGELGLGARKGPDGKKVIDVTRPRLNPNLSAKTVGVVALAVGGMHCVALTKDNKILTWGVNDQGALGRDTPQEGKMKDVGENKDETSDSDSDDDDDDSGLNPNEAEPREVDTTDIPPNTKFASVFAGDSTSWAVTTAGLVYGWGTFRSNDGILGFRENIHTQRTPMLIPELKNIKTMAVGTNHVLALDTKGKATIWGAGEQGQLARRVVSRTAKGALIPREFGLQRKKIVVLGAGDYHSFAITDKGDVYSWGLNTFGQTGVPKDEETEDNTVGAPTLVASLKDFDIKQIAGGAHHTLACTKDGKVLIWGRMDNNQGGIEIDKMDKDSLFFDEHNKPRFFTKPVVVPEIDGAFIATANDTCIAVDKEGKAFSWGFSSNYQTGQGSDQDVTHATWIDNTAVRGKKLVFAGLGGQFGIVAGEHKDEVLTNGVH